MTLTPTAIPGGKAFIQCPAGADASAGATGQRCAIPQHANTRIDGYDIQPKRTAATADTCCALCTGVEACNAFLWVKPDTCWLKTKAARARHAGGCVTGVAHLPPPAPPSPHPQPGSVNLTLSEYRAKTGRELGSVTKEMPSTEAIVAMARALLKMPAASTGHARDSTIPDVYHV